MTLQITFTGTEIADYLRVDPTQETATINILKASAMNEAEQFLNTDFSTSVTNPDGTITITPNEAPALVKEWVLNRIAEKFENRGKPVKPDYSTLKNYRKFSFKPVSNLNNTTELTETNIVNGAD